VFVCEMRGVGFLLLDTLAVHSVQFKGDEIRERHSSTLAFTHAVASAPTTKYVRTHTVGPLRTLPGDVCAIYISRESERERARARRCVCVCVVRGLKFAVLGHARSA
jgi:hypothetical protein